MKHILLFIAVVNSGLGFCQSFKWKAPLEKVGETGFYTILPGPAVTSHLKEDFSDIRIHDKKGKEVPYLFREEIPTSQTRLFKPYEIAEKRHEEGCCTFLTLHNPQKTEINNISLKIKNAQASKRAALTGSDDQQNWFVIRESIVLSPVNNTEETSEIKILDFPLTDYEYYSLRIDDSSSGPLNILSAGYYDTYSEAGKYTNVPLHFTQADSAKQTRINIAFDQHQFIDKFELSVQGAPYYLRKGKLYEKNEFVIKGKKKESFDLLQEVELSSFNSNVLYVSSIKTKQLLLVIENEDNPPLKVKDIKAYQLNRYLAAYLERGEQYSLMFGDSALRHPVYDLAYFQDSISTQTALILPKKIIAIDKEKAVAASGFFSNKIIIWIAILAVVILLGIMSIKLLRDVKPGEEKKI